MITFPSISKSLDEMLILEYKKAREEATAMLHLILSSVWFLARPGLALCGHNSDESGNLAQLLKLRAQDKPEMLKWLENLKNMFRLKIRMKCYNKVVKDILEHIHTSPFITLMVDETIQTSLTKSSSLWLYDGLVMSLKFQKFF